MEKQKRKLWSPESMEAAVELVKSGDGGLREAARLYNVPVETLRRRVEGKVALHCRPGPPTVLTEEEEARLAEYLVVRADMGFGLSRDDVMGMAFAIVEKAERKHPFKSGHAGRGWYEGFMTRHPKLTLRTPQALSYCRASSSNKETIEDFFAKLGSLYGRLNLISKPSQIYNADETGITVVHKPSKVIAELGRRNVPSLTSADRGKTHTILSCVSASGQVVPPLMIYPRKRPVPEKMREGAFPNTIFQTSESGWINKELFLQWFKLFIESISPTRPVLLILDGHSSHVTIDLIEMARLNDVHLLCLPSHTSHILQPLDVGVFKSFKSFFSKECRRYIAKHPGRVITEEVLASLVGEAYPQSHTPLNVLSGFKKTGVYPFNPGEVSDRQLAPSKVFQRSDVSFTPEQIALFKKHFEEGYDLDDPAYSAWLKLNYPSTEGAKSQSLTSAMPAMSSSGSCPTSVSSIASSAKDTTSSVVVSSDIQSTKSTPTSEEVLDELLVIPQAANKAPMKRKKKGAINDRACCITDLEVLEELKAREEAKAQVEEMKLAKKLEREKKAQERKETKEKRALERQRKRNGKEKTLKGTHYRRKGSHSQPMSSVCVEDLASDLEQLTVLHDDSDGECPNCGKLFSEECLWVCCDECQQWYDIECQKLSRKNIPERFICNQCKIIV